MKTKLIIFALLGAFALGATFVFNKRKIHLRSIIHKIESFKKPPTIQHFGIDISHHQGCINWGQVATINKKDSIRFVFMKATEGAFHIDTRFSYNWEEARKKGLKRGAYHFYNPNMNSTLQANHFINTVELGAGDLPPVLDIERASTIQSNAKLVAGLKNWLRIVEDHYGVKPIVYSGSSFYHNHLFSDLSDYPLWVANYNKYANPTNYPWHIWQFTEKGRVDGIEGRVDVNGVHPDFVGWYVKD